MKDLVRSHQLRWEGFCAELAPRIVLDSSLGYAEGKKVGRRLAPQIRSGEITAFACVNDLTALGVIQGLAGEGLEVPRDVVVMGYDNLVLTGLLGPGLPTIEAKLPEVYTRALAVLSGLVGGAGSDVHETVTPVVVTAE